MRNRRFPHTAKRFAACVVCLLGALIFQGCGKDESEPYAELDKRFPEGRPGVADVAERTQDAEYMARLRQRAGEFTALSQAAAKAKATAEHFRAQLVAALAKRVKREPPPAMVEQELAKNDHYQALLKAQREAEAAVEAKRRENGEAIRARMRAGQAAYDALRAEADAKAKAAGLPTRAEREAKAAETKAKERVLPAKAAKAAAPAKQA